MSAISATISAKMVFKRTHFPPLPPSRATTPTRTVISTSIPSSPQAMFDRQLRKCMIEEDDTTSKEKQTK